MRRFAIIATSLSLAACAASPERITLKGGKTNSNSETVGNNSGDSTNPDTLNEEDEATSALYAFDGAFPLAASLMGTNWKWDRDGHPLGWGETNVFTAMLEYMYVSGSTEYLYIIPKVYDASVNKGEKNFINEFYDDTGWWGLAWLRAYDITKEQKYLDAAKIIADYMHDTGWNNKTCGGGLYWKRGGGYKAAIANGLYIKLLAGLHVRISGDTKYLKLGKEAWDWFLKSGLVDSDNVVMDGVGEGDCKAGGTKFTYNQGLLQGAAIELYKGTQDEQYLNFAKKIVKDGMKYFTHSDGILWERHRSNGYDCDNGGDHVYFKGAYLRNLRELNEVVKDSEITAFIATTAKYAWEKSRGEYDATSLCWERGFDKHYDPGRQTSTLDLMTAAIPKKMENYALRKSVNASVSSCKSAEGPNNVLDGSSSTKWCAQVGSGSANLDIDLGTSKKVHRVRIAHSGSAAMLGDTKENNTKDFEILVSDSANGPWESAASVTGNTASGTSTLVNKKAQFLRIHISNAGADGIARIYEVIAE